MSWKILPNSNPLPSSRFNKFKRKVSIMNNSSANRTNNCYLCRKLLQTLKACNYRDSSELNRWLITAKRFLWLAQQSHSIPNPRNHSNRELSNFSKKKNINNWNEFRAPQIFVYEILKSLKKVFNIWILHALFESLNWFYKSRNLPLITGKIHKYPASL